MSDSADQPTASSNPIAAIDPTLTTGITATAIAAPASATPEPSAIATEPEPEATATEAEPTFDLSRLAVMHLPYPTPDDCPVSPMHFEQIGDVNPYPAFTFDDADLIKPGIAGGVLYAGDNKVFWWFEKGVYPEVTTTAPDGTTGDLGVTFGQALESAQAHPSSVTFDADGCWQLHVDVKNAAGEIVAEHEWQIYVYPARYRLHVVDNFGLSAAEIAYQPSVGETTATAGNHFAVLGITIANLAVDPLDALGLLPQLVLVTSTGNSVPIDVKLTEAINALDEAAIELTSGEELDLQAVFEIPGANTGVTLVATTSLGTPVELALD